jgi:hypothetical protein
VTHYDWKNVPSYPECLRCTTEKLPKVPFGKNGMTLNFKQCENKDESLYDVKGRQVKYTWINKCKLIFSYQD